MVAASHSRSTVMLTPRKLRWCWGKIGLTRSSDVRPHLVAHERRQQRPSPSEATALATARWLRSGRKTSR